MRSILILAAVVAAAIDIGPAGAAAPPHVRFSHHDWELACDNTRTCRAAGYHAQEGDYAPVSVLLERRAGPGQPFAATLRLGETNEADPDLRQVTMLVDGKALGSVAIAGDAGSGRLSGVQAEALLRAVAGSGKVAWRAGKRSWTLSGKGAAAVLLKMDEFQGRLGTRGAAVRKGDRPDDAVLPALPAPVVQLIAPTGPAPRLGQEQARTLLATLRKAGDGEQCRDLAAVDEGGNDLAYLPLTRDRMLVVARCWRGAYNEGYGYWVANRRAPFAPVLVTESGSDYDDGVITASHRGRGMGDCRGSDAWAWDGVRFVHIASGTTGMCREIMAGGAWDLPTLVTELRK